MLRNRSFLTLLVLVTLAAPLLACSVPVCRYALERWDPDAYELIVFSRGELAAEEKLELQRFRPDKFTGRMSSNVRVRVVNVDNEIPASLSEAWKRCENETLPHIAVRFPDYRNYPSGIWHAPLSKENLDSIVDSPLRRKIAMELVSGASAAWILLESNDDEQNAEALKILQEQLGVMQSELELSQPDASDIANGLIDIDPEKMELRFSLLRVKRNDPEEKFLVNTLLHTEDDLLDDEYASAPMAFPVFGRGRALFALVGPGIDGDNIEEACEFLVGPCSCQVKEQNPGTDLLLSIDWDGVVNSTIENRPVPELAGLGAFGGDESDQLAEAVSDESSDTSNTPQADGSADETNTKAEINSENEAVDNQSVTSPERSDSVGISVKSTGAEQTILRNIAVVAGVGALVVILGSVLIVRRGS